MKIAALLRQKGDFVATVRPDTTVTEALDELDRHHVGALVVSAHDRSLDGIVSERDVVRHLARSGPGVLDGPVSAIMSANVQTCGLDDDLEGLMNAMTAGRFRHVPVVQDGVLVGIVSIGDVVKARVDQLEDDRRALTDYINAR